MQIEQLFKNKTQKPKERTAHLSQLVSDQTVSVDELIAYAAKAKDPAKATCIESLEFATQTNPQILDETALNWIIECLADKAPRIKWESAKVVGNTIHLHPSLIGSAVKKLLDNTESDGTVVRWSAAFALAQVVKLKSNINSTLIPALQATMEQEEKNSIKKIYLAALKKIK